MPLVDLKFRLEYSLLIHSEVITSHTNMVSVHPSSASTCKLTQVNLSQTQWHLCIRGLNFYWTLSVFKVKSKLQLSCNTADEEEDHGHHYDCIKRCFIVVCTMIVIINNLCELSLGVCQLFSIMCIYHG